MLASVCGYTAETGVHRMDRAAFTRAVERLAPAEAATQVAHSNLWSWRELLAGGDESSDCLAFFLAGADDLSMEADEAFRRLLAS